MIWDWQILLNLIKTITLSVMITLSSFHRIKNIFRSDSTLDFCNDNVIVIGYFEFWLTSAMINTEKITNNYDSYFFLRFWKNWGLRRFLDNNWPDEWKGVNEFSERNKIPWAIQRRQSARIWRSFLWKRKWKRKVFHLKIFSKNTRCFFKAWGLRCTQWGRRRYMIPP